MMHPPSDWFRARAADHYDAERLLDAYETAAEVAAEILTALHQPQIVPPISERELIWLRKWAMARQLAERTGQGRRLILG
jgi:hypothetical protein